MNESQNDELVTSFLRYIGRTKDPKVFYGRDAEGHWMEVIWDDRSGWGIYKDNSLINHLTDEEAAKLWQRSQLPE